jgi:hypothetical protein
VRRIKPSCRKFELGEEIRCARCGGWPDQFTGMGRPADWLIDEPIILCPGCYERVVHDTTRYGRDWLIAAVRLWPIRGRSKLIR